MVYERIIVSAYLKGNDADTQIHWTGSANYDTYQFINGKRMNFFLGCNNLWVCQSRQRDLFHSLQFSFQCGIYFFRAVYGVFYVRPGLAVMSVFMFNIKWYGVKSEIPVGCLPCLVSVTLVWMNDCKHSQYCPVARSQDSASIGIYPDEQSQIPIHMRIFSFKSLKDSLA